MSQIPKNLASDLAKGREDPVFFVEHFLGMRLHNGQKRWLRKSNKKTNILIPAKRYGKSTIIAAKHIWHAFYKPQLKAHDVDTAMKTPYPTLNCAPHSTLAQQMYDYVVQIIEGRYPIKQEDGTIKFNDCKIKYFLKEKNKLPYPTVVFQNNSSFTTRTMGDDHGGSFQASSYAFISYDEAGSSDYLEDEHQLYIMPRLTDWGGNLDLVSTPDMNSKSVSYFQTVAEKGFTEDEDTEFYTQTGSVYENNFIDKKEITRLANNLDAVAREQVIYGKFVFVSGRTFSLEGIQDMFKDEIQPEDYIPGHNYVLSADLAATADWTVFFVVDFTTTPFKIVYSERFKGESVMLKVQMQKIRELRERYNTIDVIIDSSSMGGKWAQQELEDISPTCFDFKAKNKGDLVSILRSCIEERRIISPQNKALREELTWYKEDDRKLRNDCVMSLGLALYSIEHKNVDTVAFTIHLTDLYGPS